MQPQFVGLHDALPKISPLLGLVIIGALMVNVVIQVVLCLFLSVCLKRVPPQFRKQEPGMVWLLLIPIFCRVWNFFVYPRVAGSFKAYFDSIGKTDVGDCGERHAVGFCFCGFLGLIPYAHLFLVLGLVMLIVTLVKFNKLKNLMPPAAG